MTSSSSIFRINVHFIRGYYIISAFLLFIVGVGSILQSIYLQNGSDLNGLWIGKGQSFHHQGKILGITFGSFEVFVGCIGILGLIKRKKHLLWAYNIFSMIFFISCFIIAIIVLVQGHNLTDQPCGKQGWLKNYQIIGNYGESTLCTKDCVCYILEQELNYFDEETKTYISKNMTQDGEQGYVNAQSCPGFKEMLKQNNISDIEAADVVDHLSNFEHNMKCGGFCNDQNQDDLVLQFYTFTNINRGPTLSRQGCYSMMQKFYWNYAVRFSMFNWMVTFLMVLHLIFNGIYYIQRKKDGKIQWRISVFDREKEA